LAQRLKHEADHHQLEPRSTLLVDALDVDATEAAALAHDLGHPPFGHLAEHVLLKRSSKASFEGNAQSFRIVTRLSLRTPEILGLNLTRRTLNGLLKYPWLRAEHPPIRAKKWGAYDVDRDYFEWTREGIPNDTRTLEAELMDWADDITYAVHDMDDFYRAGLIPLERLTSDRLERAVFEDYLRTRHGSDGERYARAARRLFEGPLASIRTRYAGLADERINLRIVGSSLIGRYIAAPALTDDGQDVLFEIIQEMSDEVAVLKDLTWCYIIERPSLAVIQHGHRKIIDSLYDMYSKALKGGDLSVFPAPFRERAADAKSDPDEESLTIDQERVMIDLIAGMTESGATELYKQGLGVTQGSLVRHTSGLG
jgi:dGTPase